MAEKPDGPQVEQAKPTADKSAKEVRDSLAFAPDRELHPGGEPKHDADKTSTPGPSVPPIDRPPVSSPRAPEDLLRSLATGAGAHTPPDPDKYNADGTPKD